MTQSATNPSNDLRPAARSSRVRLWIALAAAAVVFGCGLFGVLPFIVALPVIGVVLALARHRTISLMPGRSLTGRVMPFSEKRLPPH